MKTLVLSIISLFILAGCVSYVNNGSKYTGATQLKINQPITVPAGSSFAYVKAIGQVVRRKRIGTYELYCKFLVPRPKDSAETVINPDTFQIHGIYRHTAGLMPIYPGVQQLAYSGYFMGGGGDSSQVDLELTFKISSVNQPQVKSLSCVRFTDPVFYNMPTLDEVKALFGDLAEFISA